MDVIKLDMVSLSNRRPLLGNPVWLLPFVYYTNLIQIITTFISTFCTPIETFHYRVLRTIGNTAWSVNVF